MKYRDSLLRLRGRVLGYTHTQVSDAATESESLTDATRAALDLQGNRRCLFEFKCGQISTPVIDSDEPSHDMLYSRMARLSIDSTVLTDEDSSAMDWESTSSTLSPEATSPLSDSVDIDMDLEVDTDLSLNTSSDEQNPSTTGQTTPQLFSPALKRPFPFALEGFLNNIEAAKWRVTNYSTPQAKQEGLEEHLNRCSKNGTAYANMNSAAREALMGTMDSQGQDIIDDSCTELNGETVQFSLPNPYRYDPLKRYIQYPVTRTDMRMLDEDIQGTTCLIAMMFRSIKKSMGFCERKGARDTAATTNRDHNVAQYMKSKGESSALRQSLSIEEEYPNHWDSLLAPTSRPLIDQKYAGIRVPANTKA